jgi:hypothetical protein
MPLIVDNTPVKMTSLANEIEAVDKRDLYTFSVLKAQELLGDKQAQEALANRYMNIKNDTTVKSIERNFLERIVDALSKAKNLEDYTRLVDEGIPTSTNPVLKDIT